MVRSLVVMILLSPLFSGPGRCEPPKQKETAELSVAQEYLEARGLNAAERPSLPTD